MGMFYRMRIDAPEWSGYCCWYTAPSARKHRVNGQLVAVGAPRDAQEFTEEQARHIAERCGIRVADDGEPKPNETIATLEPV